MKGSGIQRRIDELGRVVLPKEMRKTMGLVDGVSRVDISLENGAAVIRSQSKETLEDKIKDVMSEQASDGEKLSKIQAFLK